MKPPKNSQLRLGAREDVQKDLDNLVGAARACFGKRQMRESADALSTAAATAEQHGMYREAAQFRKALTFLASGGKPRLLAGSRL